MRVKRAVIVPAILALGLAGSILVGSSASAAVTQASGSHATASSVSPNSFYHE